MEKLNMRRLGGTLLAFLLAVGTLGGGALAKDLVPVGRAVGIELSTEGVLVAALGSVQTGSGEAQPSAEAGILPGDVIVKLGGTEIETAADFLRALSGLDGGTVAVTLRRGEELLQYNVTPAVDENGGIRLGLVLRDGVSGIGTVTFYDPESGLYGALGHSINDADTGTLLPLGEGSITKAGILDVQKGQSGTPGRLNGCFEAGTSLGTIDGNTAYGIFGFMDAPWEGEALCVAEPEEIVAGPAGILAQVEGETVREFAVEISRVYRGGDERLLVTVTDPALLELTGGIVQGMSGSPIVQNGKLVGAVTHVMMNDPTRGYGVTISAMLAAAESCTQQKVA